MYLYNFYINTLKSLLDELILLILMQLYVLELCEFCRQLLTVCIGSSLSVITNTAVRSVNSDYSMTDYPQWYQLFSLISQSINAACIGSLLKSFLELQTFRAWLTLPKVTLLWQTSPVFNGSFYIVIFSKYFYGQPVRVYLELQSSRFQEVERERERVLE